MSLDQFHGNLKHYSVPHCGNFRILIFCVKSVSKNVEVLKTAVFCHFRFRASRRVEIADFETLDLLTLISRKI